MHIVTWSVRLDETAYPLLRAGEDGITPHFHLQAFGKPSWQKMVPKSTEARSPVCWPQKTIIYREREKDLQTFHVTKALPMPIWRTVYQKTGSIRQTRTSLKNKVPP